MSIGTFGAREAREANQQRRRSCRHSTRKPSLSARQLRLVRCFVQCQYRSNVQQPQALFCLLTKRKPALVIRAVQLVLQVPIGAQPGAARQASLASGPKERPIAVRALIRHLAQYRRPPQLAASLILGGMSALGPEPPRRPSTFMSGVRDLSAAAASHRRGRRYLERHFSTIGYRIPKCSSACMLGVQWRLRSPVGQSTAGSLFRLRSVTPNAPEFVSRDHYNGKLNADFVAI